MEKENTLKETPIIGDELEKRKKQTIRFLKEKKDWIYYVGLSFLMILGIYIRTRNISRLKDITTGTWTLGPDLDPFLFLRWAKYIVENGSLMIWDNLRYVPLGYNTAGEMKLLSYMIAWFYHFLSFFSKEITVTYAAILFPVVMFALTTIAFFLFARKIFYKEKRKTRNIIALIATTFFVLMPSLLSRTIAGIPEKESAAFFFIFMAFYLFLEAFTSKKFKARIIFAVSAGVATGLLALIWGGMLFIFFTIPFSILLAFIFGKVKEKEYLIYSSWLITAFIVMMPFSTRYALKNLVVSTSTGFAIGILAIIGMSLFIMKIKNLEGIRKRIKLPRENFALFVSILILLLIILIVFGPGFVGGKINDVKSSLITPLTDRFGLTVAENRQPYFIDDWKDSFGPVVFKIPLFFWLFFIGSVVLFNNLISRLSKKEKAILTFSYFIFLIGLIFSRYSQDSILNGTSGLSLLVYFGGVLFFLGTFGYFYYKRHKENNSSVFQEFNFTYILYFIMLTLGIIGARGGIRLIMVLGAVSPVAVAFLIFKITQKYLKEKEEVMKLFTGILVLMIILASIFTVWNYYETDNFTAENFAPGFYQWQWQRAMFWVRENTPSDAVFAHWWDYGYWVQSLGERATILDGGNAIGYWNHLMGRNVLTSDNEKDALEFLYAHNGTHLLIDSTEIGKYTAFSSIGADEDYDRFSWISTFLMDESQTQETSEEIIYIYTGGTLVDEDIIWNFDGKDILFPKKESVIGAVIIKKEGEQFLQPEAVFIYKGNQYRIPLRYIYVGDKKIDFISGLNAGVFLFPKLNPVSGSQLSVNDIGAALYLSERTVNSQLVELYLSGKYSDYFKLAHIEEDINVYNLREQGLEIGDFIYYNGFRGPIKIWEINYPSNIEYKPEYISKEYPDNVKIAKSGEY